MRPHLNPRTIQECEENWIYLVGLAGLPPAERERRDPEWRVNAAWQFDHDRFLADEPYREVMWPEDRAARHRELRRREDDIDANAGMLRLPALNLDKIELGPEIHRDISLPPFKVEYDSHAQLHQKLSQTVVLLKNQPFLVVQTAEQKGKFFLYVRGGGPAPIEGVVSYDEVKDCRGIAPSYWMHRGQACWVYRTPDRQNSQGMCARNTHYKIAGSKAGSPASGNFLVEALKVARDMQYAGNLNDIISGGGSHSLRLSARVALHPSNKKGAPLAVEYCGRPMGLIVTDNKVKVYDELDLGPSWIRKDLAQVGLEMRN